MALEVGHRLVIHSLCAKIAVLGIAINEALSLKETTHPPGDGVAESGEFVTGRRLHPLKLPERSVPALDIDAVQKKHVKMDIGVRSRLHLIIWMVIISITSTIPVTHCMGIALS
jgi:hypothetical protein